MLETWQRQKFGAVDQGLWQPVNLSFAGPVSDVTAALLGAITITAMKARHCYWFGIG